MKIRFWRYVKKTPKCWIWIGAKDKRNYGRIHKSGTANISILSHRYSWEINRGKIPNGKHALHKCDNQSCVNPRHLYIGTHQDNMRDAIKRDQFNPTKGIQNPNHKLTDEMVREIRNFYIPKITPRKMFSDKFGVTESIISSVYNRKAWKHLS